jgi:hypothetical protein
VSLQELKAILPILGQVCDLPSCDGWSQLELRGEKFPDDYKEYLQWFGSGLINDFLFIFNPFAAGKGNDWHQRKGEILSGLIGLRKEFPDEYHAWRLFPERDGVLPVASTSNGDYIFWRTSGSPNEWSIIGNPYRSAELHLYPDNLTTFLQKTLTRRGYCKTFNLPFRSKPYFSARAFDIVVGG